MKRFFELSKRLLIPIALLTFIFVSSPAQLQAYRSHPSVESKKEVTVYITKTGKKYHRDGCRYLRRSKIAVKLSVAKAQGYTACSVCLPPQ